MHKMPEYLRVVALAEQDNPFATWTTEQLEDLVRRFDAIHAGQYDRWIASGCAGPPIPDDQWPTR